MALGPVEPRPIQTQVQVADAERSSVGRKQRGLGPPGPAGPLGVRRAIREPDHAPEGLERLGGEGLDRDARHGAASRRIVNLGGPARPDGRSTPDRRFAGVFATVSSMRFSADVTTSVTSIEYGG